MKKNNKSKAMKKLIEIKNAKKQPLSISKMLPKLLFDDKKEDVTPVIVHHLNPANVHETLHNDENIDDVNNNKNTHDTFTLIKSILSSPETKKRVRIPTYNGIYFVDKADNIPDLSSFINKHAMNESSVSTKASEYKHPHIVLIHPALTSDYNKLCDSDIIKSKHIHIADETFYIPMNDDTIIDIKGLTDHCYLHGKPRTDEEIDKMIYDWINPSNEYNMIIARLSYDLAARLRFLTTFDIYIDPTIIMPNSNYLIADQFFGAYNDFIVEKINTMMNNITENYDKHELYPEIISSYISDQRYVEDVTNDIKNCIILGLKHHLIYYMNYRNLNEDDIIVNDNDTTYELDDINYLKI